MNDVDERVDEALKILLNEEEPRCQFSPETHYRDACTVTAHMSAHDCKSQVLGCMVAWRSAIEYMEVGGVCIVCERPAAVCWEIVPL